jgi:hypothetical protein
MPGIWVSTSDGDVVEWISGSRDWYFVDTIRVDFLVVIVHWLRLWYWGGIWDRHLVRLDVIERKEMGAAYGV